MDRHTEFGREGEFAPREPGGIDFSVQPEGKEITAPATENPRFGKYSLLAKLGSGGMAEVFKASLINKPDYIIAIKRILPQFSRHRELVNMLVAEAGLTTGLAHPNIVPILDFGAVGDIYFIAMEYIHGKDLKSIIIRLKTRKAEFPIPLAIHVMTQVLRGLDYAHHKCDKYGKALQLVHRDISPQNVMISFTGTIKILDFGIAKAGTRSRDTESGILKGKFSYMSPEQAYGENVDPRTDVFAAGIVLWELLTLKYCFDGETDLDLLRNVRAARVRNPSSVNKKVPPELSEIVLKALERKPRKRYSSAGEFADALETYQKDRFGVLTEADTAAFLRSLYDVSLHEVETPAVAYRVPDPPSGEQAISASFRAPWVRRAPEWLAQIPKSVFVILAVILLFRIVSPGKIFLRYDRTVVNMAARFHAWRRSNTAAPPEAPPSSGASGSQPFYTVQIAPGAQRILDDLPFETFERLRDFITDLSADPRPRGVRAIPERPSSFGVPISGFRIVYQMNDLPRTITVEQVQKTAP
ncbi:MAG: protein kinase [Pseudomonadota bacterium]